MPQRTMSEIMEDLGEDFLDDIDAITREAHGRYRGYDASVLIEHDVRAQAACTYAHMVAAADRRFLGRDDVRILEIRGLKVWLFEKSNTVIRFKKMDEDGRSRNYPTKQAENFDAQLELPGLPAKPVRLTAGYLLDETGTEIVRSQIARPDGRQIAWCGAVIPKENRVAGERIWVDVTREPRFG
jgi:hypothetical protein